MKKAIISAALLTAVAVPLMLPATAEATSTTGQTSLTITPLDEKLPRIIEIENLVFEECAIDHEGSHHFSSNEPVLRFLDSRVDPIDWELQLKVEETFSSDENILNLIEYKIGAGYFEGDTPEAIEGLEAIEYSFYEANGEYAPLIRSTGRVNRGWIDYILPVNSTSIYFADGTPDGHYTAVHNWRLVNADL